MVFVIQIEEKRKLLLGFDQRGIFDLQPSLRFKCFGTFKNSHIPPHLMKKEFNLSSAPRDMVTP